MRQHRLAAAVALVGMVLSGCDQHPKDAAQVKLESPAEKASYGLGLNMGRSLLQEGMSEVDPKVVALGIEDAFAKKDARLTDDQLMQAFTALQTQAAERRKLAATEASEAGKKFLEENGKREGVTTTKSGLQYEVLKKADGAQPKDTDVVTVNYEGKLINGTVFDSSFKRGSPIDLPVSGVIQGWVEALQLMHVGEKYKIFVPAALAYGAQSPSPDIPANSVLVFELELLAIKDPKAKALPAPAEGKGADAKQPQAETPSQD